MKKTLIALAALAATGAFAQSSVSVYGVVDASYNYASSGSLNAASMGSSQLGSSKLGFMGTEDLGGGLAAVFKLEGGLANDSGNGKASNTNNQSTGGVTVGGAGPTVANAATTNVGLNGTQGLVFQRYSFVGLKGGFGELHLGREYVSSFQHGQGAVDPFGTNGPADSTQLAYQVGKNSGKTLGAAQNITNISNMITYTSPSMGGASGGLQLYMGENTQGSATATDNGSGYSAFVDYTGGPLFVTLAQSVTKFVSTATDGDYLVRALSASYDFGMAKVAFTNTHEEAAYLGSTPKNDSNLIGVTVPMGALTLKASYINAVRNSGAAGAKDEKGDLLGLGVDYALSKRTKVYATYANVKNTDGASYFTGVTDKTVGGSSDNVAIGVFHSF